MTDPTTVTRDQVHAALAALDIPRRDVTTVTITPAAVTVTRLRRDAAGRCVAAGDQPATTITTIAIRYTEETTDEH